MITDTESTLSEINRLSGKKGWPYLFEGQLELVRIAKKYARDASHLNAVITLLSETLEHCPDGRELRLELCRRTDQPDPPTEMSIWRAEKAAAEARGEEY